MYKIKTVFSQSKKGGGVKMKNWCSLQVSNTQIMNLQLKWITYLMKAKKSMSQNVVIKPTRTKVWIISEIMKHFIFGEN